MKDKTDLGMRCEMNRSMSAAVLASVSDEISGCRRYLVIPHGTAHLDVEEMTLYDNEFTVTDTREYDIHADTQIETDIEVGFTVRDTLSGFEGTVVRVMYRLHNCVRVTIADYDAAFEDGANTKPTTYTIDAPRVEIVNRDKPEIASEDGPGPDDPEAGPIGKSLSRHESLDTDR